jgi:hypothetical protein
MWKIILSAVIIMAITPAFARGRTLPAGPADYVDDNGFSHGLYSDWPGIQGAGVSSSHRRRPSHKHDHDSSDR